MALSLSSKISLSIMTTSPPSASFSSSSSSKSQQQQIQNLIPHQSRRHRVLGVSLSNSLSSRFRPSLAYRNSTPHGYNSQHDARTPASSAEPTQNPSFKSLLKVYKEAILYRDLETIAEVEAVISSFDNEKNELLQVISGFEKEKNDLLQKISDMSTEISSGKDKYIRLRADFENFRRRSEKERLTIRSDAQGEVLESLLPMVDSFEKAKQIVKPETEREIKIDTSYQGIYKQFVEIMRSLRIGAVPTVGKPFDPAMHEAIAREESQEFKEGIVIQELRRGFLLGSRLLRPAMVKVSSGPGKIKVTEKSTATAAGLDER